MVEYLLKLMEKEKMICIECIGDGRKACDKCEYVDVLLTKAKLPCKDKEKCIIVKNSVWKLDRK